MAPCGCCSSCSPTSHNTFDPRAGPRSSGGDDHGQREQAERRGREDDDEEDDDDEVFTVSENNHKN